MGGFFTTCIAKGAENNTRTESSFSRSFSSHFSHVSVGSNILVIVWHFSGITSWIPTRVLNNIGARPCSLCHSYKSCPLHFIVFLWANGNEALLDRRRGWSRGLLNHQGFHWSCVVIARQRKVCTEDWIWFKIMFSSCCYRMRSTLHLCVHCEAIVKVFNCFVRCLIEPEFVWISASLSVGVYM